MNMRLVWVLAPAVVIPLAYCYFSFLLWVVLGAAFLPSNAIEVFIITTAALRVAAVVSIKRLRRTHILLIIDMLSIEILSLPLFFIAYILLGNQIFIAVIKEILFAWPSAILLVLLPYGIYKLASLMREGASLVTVLPCAVALFVFLAILDSATTLAPQGIGLVGLSGMLASVFFGGTALGPATPGIAITGVLLYVSLMLYATTWGRDIHASANPILFLATIGALTTVGWAFLALNITSFAAIALGVPGLALVAALWVVSHAH